MASDNVLNTGNLTTAQRKALDALAYGATKEQAATIAGRTERTVNRWIHDDPEFTDALKVITDDAVSDASRRLASLLDNALDVLLLILNGPDAPDHVRLRAVDMVIGNLIKLRELGDLEERIAALEEMQR